MRTGGKKLKRKDCRKIEEIGHYLYINLYKMEIMPEEQQQQKEYET
jgi:hypothetical protein